MLIRCIIILTSSENSVMTDVICPLLHGTALTEVLINLCQVWGGSLGEAHAEKICKVVSITTCIHCTAQPVL